MTYDGPTNADVAALDRAVHPESYHDRPSAGAVGLHRPHVEKSGKRACPVCLEEWPCRTAASTHELSPAQGLLTPSSRPSTDPPPSVCDTDGSDSGQASAGESHDRITALLAELDQHALNLWEQMGTPLSSATADRASRLAERVRAVLVVQEAVDRLEQAVAWDAARHHANTTADQGARP